MEQPGKLVCNVDENKKKVYIAISQIVNAEQLLLNAQLMYDSRQLACRFNTILTNVKDVFACDPVFAQSIAHMEVSDVSDLGSITDDPVRHKVLFSAIVTDMAILKGTLAAFIDLHLSDTEKKSIGFQGRFGAH